MAASRSGHHPYGKTQVLADLGLSHFWALRKHHGELVAEVTSADLYGSDRFDTIEESSGASATQTDVKRTAPTSR